MKRRILLNMCSLALVTVTVSLLLILSVFYGTFNNQIRQEIRNEANYVSAALNAGEDDNAYLTSLGYSQGEARITLIAPDGTVLFDNVANVSTMENHGDRPEVVQAFREGRGESLRTSATIGTQTFYEAVLLKDNSVVRLAVTTHNIWAVLVGMLPLTLVILLAAVLLSILLANQMTRKIIQPINTLDLERPLDNADIYDELSILLLRIDRQNEQIRKQMEQMKTKQEEFAAITENMSEGLIVLDTKGSILSVNKRAISLLSSANMDYTGKDILVLNRNLALQNAVSTALSGKRLEKIITIDDESYQLFVSPVYENNAVRGVIILILDVTEKQQSEQMRREFTANVSHELKTPLTSISGYAEMMENGMVKAEDIQDFAGKIHSEANRLIALVQDIIKLSQLDEKQVQVSFENVSLRDVMTNVMEHLKPQAQQKNIHVTCELEEVKVMAIPQMLEEMFYNLYDNAIKYNKPGGSVNLSVKRNGDSVTVEFADTGIGIAKAHQSRVFERFYRVDKSHSKQTGGTGLGLSIVKHIAEYLGARIELESLRNVGTKVRIIFSGKSLV